MRLISLSVFTLLLSTLTLISLASDPDPAARLSPIASSPSAVTPEIANRAPVEGSGVFHTKERHVWTTPQGEEKDIRENEFWFDPATQNARYDQKSLKSGFQQVEIRTGLTLIVYDPDEGSMTANTVVDPTVRGLQLVQENVFLYKHLLESGDLKPIDEVRVRGRLANVVQRKV